MDKVYDQLKTEEKWYKFWEESGFFKPEVNPQGKPYCIIMPPPNANESLHIGHARFVTIEDILIRYARMQGKAALWQPGTDHAGIETQYVFEKKLAAEGKSRFDFDSKTLYQMIWDYVEGFRGVAVNQMKKLGASADWSREKFSLDPEIIKIVNETFKMIYRDHLLDRKETLVNYCTYCGTSYSELEVDHVEREDEIYTLDYGPIKIATTRPETIFADVAVAVNPKDKRFQNMKDQKAVIPLINIEIPIIEDSEVDMEFGTGALKITPAHDKTDFEVGLKHNLPIVSVIDESGRLNDNSRVPEKYRGQKVKAAREAVVADLEAAGLLLERQKINHSVGVCYRCKNVIEPMVSIQWFIKVKDPQKNLTEMAAQAVKEGKTKFTTKRYEKIYFHWLENLRDWNISRQIVWGIKIPIFYQVDNIQQFFVGFVDKNNNYRHGPLNQLMEKEQVPFAEIEKGLVNVYAAPGVKYVIEEEKEADKLYLPETNTFDTWFSSGQWPYATLMANNKDDFAKFYPTEVMETGYDILPFWVMRMMMLGLYRTNEVPFKNILLHGLVRDAKGEKISKSKGNVINPLDMAEKYGTDALRMSLVWGALVENDVALSEDNIRGQRNFTNKLWNIGRFIMEFKPEGVKSLELNQIPNSQNSDDQKILQDLNHVIKTVSEDLDNYRLNEAAETLYDFIWHKFADVYIEQAKQRREESQPILEYVFRTSLELLHPFMPFITEELWQKLPHEGKSSMVTSWPKSL
jgi:valyl-tRNA synthetase